VADLRVLRAGLSSTVQDLGRVGYAALGVPRSGAVDADSLRLANRLVGNPQDAAGIETTLLGVDLRLAGTDADSASGRWVAVTGAVSPVRLNGRPAADNRPLWLPTDASLEVGPAVQGLRAYVAVSGGIAVPPVLGSRATDLLSGLGPPPLDAGDRIALGPAGAGPAAAVDVAPRPALRDRIEARLLPGPREDWFEPEALRVVVTSQYMVSDRSNRVGVRLDGPPLARRISAELPSEGIPLGALQVPSGGQPIVHLADHPTTGGYPVIGVVHAADLWLLAQARPGSWVRFRFARLSGS
jgi:biotin-dependent carboxylase-like uncharacterized protein